MSFIALEDKEREEKISLHRCTRCSLDEGFQ